MDALTVRRVLREPCLSRTEVAAGAAGLERPVQAVGVLDVSDLEAITPGQFVLSNAYPMRDLDLVDLVHRLVRRGASALGVKLSPVWVAIPDELRRSADDAALPLLILPDGPFDEILNPILASLAGRQVERLRRSAEVHDALARAAASEGGDPAGVAAILADALGRPVAILGERGDVIAAAGTPVDWPVERILRSPGPGLRSVRTGSGIYLVAPISGVHVPSGAVCVEGIDALDRFGRECVTHGAISMGMILAGSREVERIHLGFRRQLLEDLVDGRITTAEEARHRAARVGWDRDEPYVVAVAAPSAEAGGGRGLLDLSGLDDARIDEVAREVGSLDLRVWAFVRPPGLALLVHLRADEDASPVVDDIALRVRRVRSPLDLASTIVSAGDVHRDPASLADAHREAGLAHAMSRHTGGRRVVRFSDLGPVRLLARATDRTRLTLLADRSLGPLAGGSDGRGQLFETLAVLLSVNMRLTATSERTFFHYNTVRHRVSRLHELLGDRLTTPQGRLVLSLAVAARQLEEAETALGS